MSSPTKRRAALAGKNVNVKHAVLTGNVHKSNHSSNHSSPAKKSQVGLNYALRCSPVRHVSLSPKRSTTPSATKTTFTFHEETPSEKAAVLIEHMSLLRDCKLANDENDFIQVKENTSPSKISKKVHTQQNLKRVPLRDLSIEDYKGYIEDPYTSQATPLTLHYNQKTKLPNFVTPPRDSKLKEYFTYNNLRDAKTGSRSTDDIPKDKIIKKLNFKICEN